VLSYPLFALMHHPDPALIFVAQLGFVVLIAAYLAPYAALMAEMFSRAVRCSGVSVAYNVPLAIFGGTTPMVATYLIGRSHDDLSPAYYMIACALIAVGVLLVTPETGRTAID